MACCSLRNACLADRQRALAVLIIVLGARFSTTSISWTAQCPDTTAECNYQEQISPIPAGNSYDGYKVKNIGSEVVYANCGATNVLTSGAPTASSTCIQYGCSANQCLKVSKNCPSSKDDAGPFMETTSCVAKEWQTDQQPFTWFCFFLFEVVGLVLLFTNNPAKPISSRRIGALLVLLYGLYIIGSADAIIDAQRTVSVTAVCPGPFAGAESAQCQLQRPPSSEPYDPTQQTAPTPPPTPSPTPPPTPTGANYPGRLTSTTYAPCWSTGGLGQQPSTFATNVKYGTDRRCKQIGCAANQCRKTVKRCPSAPTPPPTPAPTPDPTAPPPPPTPKLPNADSVYDYDECVSAVPQTSTGNPLSLFLAIFLILGGIVGVICDKPDAKTAGAGASGAPGVAMNPVANPDAI